MWRETLIAMVAAILLSWLAIVDALAIVRPKGNLLHESLRILPDLIRLLKKLTTDQTQPRGIRVRLALGRSSSQRSCSRARSWAPVPAGSGDGARSILCWFRARVLSGSGRVRPQRGRRTRPRGSGVRA